jgi:monoamine oxidase
MIANELDAVIIGAGAAGLAALKELDCVGRKVVCVEARDRIGGRVHTVIDPLSPVPLELGAEFIHGRSPEIWDVIRSHGLIAYDCAQTAVRVKVGKAQHGTDGWELIDGVMQDMQKAAKRGKDRSFSIFLEGSSHSAGAKRLAMSYVEGFNAARGELVSIRSLAKDAEAADEIEGDRSFRFVNGYRSLILQLISGVADLRAKLRINRVVERIEWESGHATVHARSALSGQAETFRSRSVVITAPLGVLKSGGISFEPEPQATLEAAQALEFGQVMRVSLRFREAFWEENDEFACAGFLLSNERFFPTWWTALPVRAPVLTGWCAGSRTDDLLEAPRSEIVGRAVADLSRITGFGENRLSGLLENAYLHDWHADPFARGAYSYVPVGALRAREKLAEPVEDTLYFAGEATEVNGHSATVHGAIASGRRAARQILARE